MDGAPARETIASVISLPRLFSFFIFEKAVMEEGRMEMFLEKYVQAVLYFCGYFYLLKFFLLLSASSKVMNIRKIML